MKIGFTGTRQGMSSAQTIATRGLVDQLIAGNFDGDKHLEDIEFHMGDCLGADTDFYHLVGSLWRRVGHPPINGKHRAFLKYDEERPPKEYLVRNRDIVDETTILIATPKEMKQALRSGTWTTFRYAERKKRIIYTILPTGTIEVNGL